MTNKIIYPGSLAGSITVPPSKSVMQRACAAALLRGGTTIIENAGAAQDNRAALSVIEGLGASVNELAPSRIAIDVAPEILRQDKTEKVLDCGESGLCIRMFTPVAALAPGVRILTGKSSLLTRPMEVLAQVLPRLQVHISSNGGRIPLNIQGPISLPPVLDMDGDMSSQFLTGILFAYAGAHASGHTINVRKLTSKPYIDLTLTLLREFGLPYPEHSNYETFYFPQQEPVKPPAEPKKFVVEGDWSNAAFLLAGGAISGNISLRGLNRRSMQADIRILDGLASAGCPATWNGDLLTISSRPCRPFDFDATDCPDLFPPLVALAAHGAGVSRIRGVTRLAHKESNRAESLVQEFSALGIAIGVDGDTMWIKGGVPKANNVDAHADHRIAMAGAIAAIGADEPVTILGASAVEKSYPNFFDDLKTLGLVIEDHLE